MEKPRRVCRIDRINKILDMPKEIYTKDPKITIQGFKEIGIENYKGIIEYEENYIKLETFIGNINIEGINLNLERMTEDILKITGKITAIHTDF